jgi:hypothetical protein
VQPACANNDDTLHKRQFNWVNPFEWKTPASVPDVIHVTKTCEMRGLLPLRQVDW